MGVSILLITQRIPDILAIADRVFVLKGGRRQDILDVGQVTLDDVVTLIVKGKAPEARRSADGVPLLWLADARCEARIGPRTGRDAGPAPQPGAKRAHDQA